jgi:hypothetical protein
LQPVVLLTGQAAGAIAANCILKNIPPHKISIRAVQQSLLDAKCYLLPYVDIEPGDKDWEAIQKAGATGILQGTGIPDGWANKTFFYPDSTISFGELQGNINRFIPCLADVDTMIRRPVSVKESWDMLTKLLHAIRIKKGIPHKWPSIVANEHIQVWKKNFTIPFPGNEAPVTRRQIAILMNALATHPFQVDIDFYGRVK